MGLGKTIQYISFLAYLAQYRNKPGKHLVLVPKSTLSNWVLEFSRWVPALRVLRFHGNKDERRDLKNVMNSHEFDICLTTYETMIIERTAIKKINWETLCVDEAHRLKNESSKFYVELNQVSTNFRLLMTGTPLQNNLHELWALLSFLLPDIFSSAEDFDELMVAKTPEEEHEALGKLHAILRPFMLRRLKSEVAKTLPSKKEIVVMVGMSTMQKRVYRDVISGELDVVNGMVLERKKLYNIMMQLRKVACHPYLIDGVEDRTLPVYGDHLVENSGKLMVLEKLLERVVLKEKSKVLIFSQFSRVLDLLEDFCYIKDYNCVRIDGQTSSEDREESINTFNDRSSPVTVFLLTTRAGGLGLNLTTANVVILFDSDWNPQMDLQAQDRAHRIGQTRPVFIYRFITEHSIEEKILERADMKLRLDALVIQQGRLAGKKKNNLSEDSMLHMIQYGADEVFRSTSSSITDDDIDELIRKSEEKMGDRLKERDSKFKDIEKGLGLDLGKSTSMIDVDSEWSKTATKTDLAFVNKMQEALSKRVASSEVGNRRKARFMSALRDIHEFQFFDRSSISALEQIEQTQSLTPEQVERKKLLLQQGFRDWDATDFSDFCKACETFGRNDLDNICKSVDSKTSAEVLQYSAVFWARGPSEIDDWPKVVKKIESAERKLESQIQTRELLVRVVSRYENPRDDLTFNYTAKQKRLGYTSENDRFLVMAAYDQGSSSVNFNQISYEISKQWEFQFDYYFRSRSAKELQKRFLSLMRGLDRDMKAYSRKRSRAL